MNHEYYIKGIGRVDKDDVDTFEKIKPKRTKAEIRERKERRRRAGKGK